MDKKYRPKSSFWQRVINVLGLTSFHVRKLWMGGNACAYSHTNPSLECPAEMAEEIGIAKHAPKTNVKMKWNYESLKYRPPEAPEYGNWVTSIYRGIVPAKNIEKRDFAIAGAFVS